MSISLKDSQTNVQGGLGTFTHTCGNTGLYYVSCLSTVIPPSGLSVVINHNGSPVTTSVATTTASNHVECLAPNISCTAGDTLSVVLTSSAASDNVPNVNNVQSLIRVGLLNL